MSINLVFKFLSVFIRQKSNCFAVFTNDINIVQGFPTRHDCWTKKKFIKHLDVVTSVDVANDKANSR